MKITYIILIVYLSAVISASPEGEVIAENINNAEKPLSSSYTYSIEYNDNNNHGNYGHKIEVKDGSAKVNVHAQHPQFTEQIISPTKQDNIQRKKPIKVKQQEVVYRPAQEIHNAIPHPKVTPAYQHAPVASPATASEKLPIHTLDKHQLALLLAQNKNPFLPLTSSKDVTSQTLSQPAVHSQKYSSLQNQQPAVSYYVPQDQTVKDYSVQYQGNTPQLSKPAGAYSIDPNQQYTFQYSTKSTPKTTNRNVNDYSNQYQANNFQISKPSGAYTVDPKQQYTYQYPTNSIPTTSKQTTNLVPNQQNYYYPSSPITNEPVTHADANQFYQNYHQYQNPTPSLTAQQYTVPRTKTQQTQQYVQPQTATHQTVPQAAHLTQYLAGAQYGIPQSQSGPVQFLPQHQTQSLVKPQTVYVQNNPTYPSTNVYEPKGVNSGYPEIPAYPTSLFQNVQYGSAPSVAYKPIETSAPNGKTNSYDPLQGLQGSYANYGTSNTQGIDPSASYKQSVSAAPIQDIKQLHHSGSNLGQFGHYNFGNPHEGIGLSIASSFKPSVQAPGQELNKIDYSQIGLNLNQGKHQVYNSGPVNNQYTNLKQNSYISNIQTAPKTVLNSGSNTAYVNVQGSNYFGAENVQKYYSPNAPAPAGVAPEHSNVRYIYVPAYPAPQQENNRN